MEEKRKFAGTEDAKRGKRTPDTRGDAESIDEDVIDAFIRREQLRRHVQVLAHLPRFVQQILKVKPA